MTRVQQSAHNQHVIQTLIDLVSQHKRYSPPPYKSVVVLLNAQGLLTSRGNPWTPKRLFRMLQRHNISGLHGLRESIR